MPKEQPTPKNDLDAIRKRSLAYLETWGEDGDPPDLAVASADDVPTLLGMLAAQPKRKHIHVAMAALSAIADAEAFDPKTRKAAQRAYDAFEAWRLP